MPSLSTDGDMATHFSIANGPELLDFVRNEMAASLISAWRPEGVPKRVLLKLEAPGD